MCRLYSGLPKWYDPCKEGKKVVFCPECKELWREELGVNEYLDPLPEWAWKYYEQYYPEEVRRG